MREILFRGKRIDNGEWVEGYYAFVDNVHYIYTGELYNGGLYVVAERFEIDQSTICQYTGLTDKNGRKIFEGDIICNHYDDEHPEDECFCVVVWDKTSWKIRENGSADLVEPDEHDTEGGEVIGNIFDNPELMEDEQC